MAKRRGRSGPYRLTPARRGALKKAQLASARKRRRNIGIALGVSAGALTAGGIVARHKLSGSTIQARTGTNTSSVTGKRLGSGFRSGPNSVTGALGSRKVSLSYTHKPLQYHSIFGQSTKSRVVVSGVNDNIPLYNPKTRRSWPHTDPAKSRRTNQRLRERGMIA